MPQVSNYFREGKHIQAQKNEQERQRKQQEAAQKAALEQAQARQAQLQEGARINNAIAAGAKPWTPKATQNAFGGSTASVNLTDTGTGKSAQTRLNELQTRSQQLQTERTAAKAAERRATAERDVPRSVSVSTGARSVKEIDRELDDVRKQIRNVRPAASQQAAASAPSYDGYDFAAAQKNLQTLQAQAADTSKRIRRGTGSLRNEKGDARLVSQMREQKADLERQIQAQEMEIRKAEYYQKSKKYAGMSRLATFERNAKTGSLKKGNDVMWVRNHADQYKQLTESGHGANGKDGKYLYMTEDEVKTYNYLFATDEKKAKEYLDFIEDALNYRMGTEMGEKVRGIDNDFGRFAATTLYGVYAGLDQFMSGATQFLSSDQRPTSAAQYGSAYVREDLADYGGALPGWMGGASLAQAAYDTVTTTANMAPSILLSSLTGGITGSAALAQGVGAVTLGASAAGNAYGQALAEGYDKKSARIYSTMVGISEAYLQNVLGGITALGGLPEKTARWVANWDSALLRASANVGLNMLGEGAEEYLQDILEPALRNAILLENNSVDLVTPEAIYSGLLGALTAGFLEGPSTVSTDIQRNRYGAQLRGNHMDKNLIEVSLRDMDQSTQAYQTAKDIKSGKLKDSTHNLGTLFEQYVQEGGDMTVFDAAPDGRGGIAFNTGSGGEAYQRAKGLAQSRESGYTERVPERLDDITTDYVHVDQGGGNHMSLAKAQEKADILSSYAAGEQVSAKDINKLGLTQTSLREVFERYTGVTLPEDFNKQSDSAKIQTVMRLQPKPEVSAAQVAEQSRVGGFAKIRPYIPTSAVEGYDMTPVLAPDGVAAPGMPGAVIAPRPVVESVKDGSLGPGFERVEDQTDTKWAPDLNSVAVQLNGQNMTLSEFSDYMKTLPGEDEMTADEVREEFLDTALEQGKISQTDYDFYKEGMGNGTARSERTDGNAGGLAGRTGERPGERSGGVDQAAGRAEAQSGSGRADADAGGRGRGAEVSGRDSGVAGQDPEGVRGTGSAREGTEREDRRVSAARKLKTEAVKDNKGREVMKRVTDEAFVSTEDGRELNKLFRSIGVEVRGMVGRKTLYNAADKVIGHADGEAVPGRLTTIRMDSPRYTPGQLGRHEFGHQVFYLSDGTFAKARNALLSKMSAFELLDTEQAYRRVFADVYRSDFKEKGKELTDDVLRDMLIEEMLCDAYAGIDRAGTQLSVYRDTVTPVIEEARQTIQKNRGLTEDGEVRHSIDSLAEAAGLFFEKNGQATVLKDSKGKEIDKVTEEMITKSPLGAVIQAGKDGGFINDEQVEKQTKFFADLYNLILKTQDVDMLWAVSSSIGFQPIESGAREHTAIGKIKSKFAGFTKNSDPQYSSTVDFTTICLKTQAVIDAMSETMKKLGHGLTEDEIVNIVYKNTHEAGEPVPCPVCYVFSRWVGLGGLFDKMLRLQAQYADADPERIRSDIAELENRVREYARSHDLDEFNKSGKLNSEARDKLYKTLWKEYDELSYRAYVDRVKGTSTMTDKDKARMEELKPIIQYFDNWTWLTDVRLSDNYQAVPADVLLDINAGKTFAEDYPESWRYRTTRGPAMGKAATPYADEHLGQILRGVGMGNLKDLGDNTKNPFLNKSAQGGKLGKAARAMLEKSRLKMKIQNLLNGQRFQSTSDFRFEYALDYLTAFLEMQTLGGKVQLYTKVPEAVSFFATVNAEVNCSLMPLGEGVTTDADGNRVLTFSNVTGMNAEDAFRLQSLFDNVQTILVGVGDEHIRIAMQDDRIQFIIPYHASGASEARYKSLMDVVGESVGSRADYSDYQTDHKIADATQTQKDTAEVRIKLLTGKLNLPDASEKALVRNHPILSELYKRFYGTDVDGNQSAIDPRYLTPELREGDVYRDPECFGAFLSKDQAEHIMPFEYWDRTSTTETADDQGQAFVDYCETLGLHPRFSGWDAKGKYHAEKDFTKVPGYWKTLGDRRLYNNDGTYHEQKAIDVTGMKADFLFREPSEQGIVQPSRANDRSKTEQIAEKSAKEIRELRQRNLEDLREQETAAAAEEPTSRAMKDTWKAAKAIDDTGARYSIATELENNEQLTDADRELLTVTQSVLDKVDAGKGWTGREVNEFYRNNPEYDFVARFFDGDKGTKKSMQAFVARIHDLQTLNALSWYSTQNHWDPAGRYRGSITKARNVYKARIDELARDLGGQPIKLEHRAYTLKEARDLFDQYNTNEALTKLADKVFPLAERFHVQVYASSKVYDKAFGKYSGMNSGPYVWLNRSYFGDSLHVGQSKASTILHEMIHSVTVYALDPDYRNDDIYSDPNVQEAVNRLEEVYNEVKADPAFAGDYGITNIKEFAAELANVKFREKLAKKNLLQRVIDAIRKFFGIETETALDGASAALDYLLDNVDEDGLLTYHRETRRKTERWEAQTGKVRYSISTELENNEQLTETQEKNRNFNNQQTKVGSPLKTLNGSVIKRYQGIAGKEVSGQVYVHKQYAEKVIPGEVLHRAERLLGKQNPDFTYKTVMYDKSKGTVRFDEAPDFDTAREPIAGNYVSVDLKTGKTKAGYTDYIWHHKWLWVENDYAGFDVEQSWNWSKQWLNVLRATDDAVSNRGRANGSGHGTANWNKQLEYFGLPVDAAESVRYSVDSVAPVKQDHTSRGTSINTKKLPALYTKAKFEEGTTNIDIGAGVEATPATRYLAEQGVTSLPFDPFNRSKETNKAVTDFLKSGKKADTATCSNCLNVIDNAEARANVILQMAKSIKPDGTAYFTVYENKTALEAGKAGENAQKQDQWQEFRAVATYVPEIKQFFNDVPKPKNGLIIARDPKPNLPKAVWQIASTEYTDSEGNHPYSEDETVRYSISPETERAYETAVSNDDMDTAARLVKEAAAKAGYTVEGYHGTLNFGFTRLDVNKSDDKRSFFVTTDPTTAQTYSATEGTRRVADRGFSVEEREDAEDKAQREARSEASGLAGTLSGVAGVQGFIDAGDLADHLVGIIESAADINEQSIVVEDQVEEYLWDLLSDVYEYTHGGVDPLVDGYDDYADWLDNSAEGKRLQRAIDDTLNAAMEYFRVLHLPDSSGNYHLFIDPTGFLEIDADGTDWNRINFMPDELRQMKVRMDEIERNHKRGDGPLTNNQEWLDLSNQFDARAEEIYNKYLINPRNYSSTRGIARYASAEGYPGIHIKNIIDDGGRGKKRVTKPADIYILFDPQSQAKSADPMVFDDNEELIPLGERFNRSNDDIRYSISPERRAVLDALRREALQNIQAEQQNDGTGAANAGEVNTDYDRLQAQSENFHDSGPAPARHTDVPKQDFEGRNIPKSASTVYGANGTTDSAAKQLEGMIASGELSFDTETDTRAVGLARRTLNGKGFDGALEQYRNNVNNGTASKDNVALGQQLLLQAMRDGNDEATAELLTLYTRNSTTVAQALQAQSMFRKLSPEGQLIGLRKAIEAINEKYGTNVELTEDEVGEYTRAGSQEEREKVHEKIVKRIAETLPRNFKAKFDAIRYLAMLGNPRTHIRNILGNALFQAPVIVKNRIGAVGELLASAVSGGKVERTKSLTGIKSQTLIKEAQEDFKKVKDHLGQINKYNENKTVMSEIEQSAPAFSNGNVVGKTLNTLAEGNSNLLELEDMAFKRYIYVQSLAGYLQANGIQSIAEAEKSINGRKVLVRAREYAAQEAMRNTFNDRNQASDAVSSLGKLYRSENKVARAAGYVVEGVVPFKRTPTNILVRALEYSPAGVLNGIYVLTKGVKGKNSTEITRGIDRLAAGVSGSALFALGMMLAAAGRIKGGEDDDEKQKNFDSLRRRQNYSIELDNGKSVTLDWLAPEAIPFFMGVEMYGAALEGGLSWEDLSKVAKNTTSPMLEMSMLQGLNDAFDNAAYAKNQGNSVLGSVLASALTSYVTQVFPTILGQAERTAEDQRMTTYTDKNSSVPTDLQYTLGKVSQKVPHWDYNQIPFIDAWGRTTDTGSAPERAFNNMANPAYVSQVSRDPVEDELQRLYDATGESVLPERAAKKVKINKEEKNLTAEEYVTYATQLGQDRYSYVSAFIQSNSYAKLDDAARAKAIKEMYEYADKKAKSELFGQEPESDYSKITAALKEHNISPDVYTAAYARTSGLTSIKDKDGKSVNLSKSLRIMKEVYQIPGLSKDQIQYLAEALGAGKTVLGYSEKMVDNKLKAMENKYGKYNP